MIPSQPFIRDSMLAIRTNKIAFVFYNEQIEVIKELCIKAKIDITVHEGKDFVSTVFKRRKLNENAKRKNDT